MNVADPRTNCGRRAPIILGNILALSTMVTSCYHTSALNSKLKPKRSYETKASHFMWGFSSTTIEIECKRVQKIEESLSVGQVLLSVATIGIYLPRTYRITCG